jgi:hypothetical protein
MVLEDTTNGCSMEKIWQLREMIQRSEIRAAKMAHRFHIFREDLKKLMEIKVAEF